jgi:uncharacterized OB-fold protein
MPLNERITSTDEMRAWTDKIPLRYEYTAGLAGERFLRGLKEGKLLAGRCKKCGKTYLPPKSYCVECFAAIEEFVTVGPRGTVAALTESWVDFQGRRMKNPSTFAFVMFKGVEGGIIQRAEGKSLRIGSAVEPRFAPESARKGSLADIERFVGV